DVNVNPGGKQQAMRDTVIPLTNPPPKPGQLDTRGMPQKLVYPNTHPDLRLRGKPKGMKAAMGQEDMLSDNDISQAEEVEAAPESEWCCMYRVLSLQEDFATEKPMIQHYIESRGHVCMFLPKFHCELNPIELLWGYAKYHEILVPQCLDMCETLIIRRFFRKTWRYMDAYR
ncbi:hypothetical protein P692DRAFT_201705046, partial [Suillus brevipes Sb2]